MARITCDYCGTQYDDIQQRCPLCGSINQSDPAQAESGEHGQKGRGGRYSAPKASRPSRPSTAAREEEEADDRIPKWLTIMICVVLGLAVVIGALYAMYAVGVFSPKTASQEDLTLPEQQITEDTNKTQNTQQPEDQEQGNQQETTPTEVLCTGITLSESSVTLESAGLATTVTATV